ncbi:MAG: succinate dehydrogenase [Flavobacteriales bacterium]|nr:MAG: succinate dehydrogenase [Flavobacteriales bacterium]
MATVTIEKIQKNGFFETLRTDSWRAYPITVLIGLGGFLIYGTWSALQADYYWFSIADTGFGGYLAPFYSPLFFIKEGVAGAAPIEHAIFGPWPQWWPSWIPPSPSLLILAIPGVFRFTCYYYRKAYYRAFTGTPPACAVGALPRKGSKGYVGETGLMVVQNLHRYAMYFAIIYIFIFFYDAFLAFFNNGKLGIGVGTILILGNAILLGAYTFGCHSVRHLIGGRLDCYSCSMGAKRAHSNWKLVTWLNERHEKFAWISMIWIMVADLYIRLVSMGVITDLNTW